MCSMSPAQDMLLHLSGCPLSIFSEEDGYLANGLRSTATRRKLATPRHNAAPLECNNVLSDPRAPSIGLCCFIFIA